MNVARPPVRSKIFGGARLDDAFGPKTIYSTAKLIPKEDATRSLVHSSLGSHGDQSLLGHDAAVERHSMTILRALSSIQRQEVGPALDHALGAVQRLILSTFRSMGCDQRDPIDDLIDVATMNVIRAVVSPSYEVPISEGMAVNYVKTIASSCLQSHWRREGRLKGRMQSLEELPERTDDRSVGPDEHLSMTDIFSQLESEGRTVYGNIRFSAFLDYCRSWITLSSAARRVGAPKTLVGRQFSRIREWIRGRFGKSFGFDEASEQDR